MNDLEELNRDKFEYREWVALTWARQYLLHEGEFPDPDLVGEFRRLFSLREQTDIMAAVKMMCFFNMLSNTIFKEPVSETANRAIEPKGAGNR